MKRINIIVALVVLAAATALYFSLSLIIDQRAVIFPRIVILVMGVLALLLLLQALLFQPAGNAPESDAPPASPLHGVPWGTTALVLIGILLYLWVMQDVGFYLSTFIFFAGIVFLLSRKTMTFSKGLKISASALVFTAVLFFLFNILLKVQMPRGIFY
jgi:hypothetical protein